jgi:hypothetical protein
MYFMREREKQPESGEPRSYRTDRIFDLVVVGESNRSQAKVI